MSTKREFCKQQCQHCSNVSLMEKVAFHLAVTRYEDEIGVEMGYYGWRYDLFMCPSCDRAILSREQLDSDMPSELVGTVEVLYPHPSRCPLGLPATVKAAYEAANRVRTIDPNAYAVLLGRVLDKVCIDRGAGGKSLFERLTSLAATNQIPKELLEMAQSLRHLRNFGAHADLGELTEEEIPFLDDLCRAILEFVYSAPQLLARVKERLAQLGRRNSLSTEVQEKPL